MSYALTASVVDIELTSRLYRYHEELKVRDARAKGREEGRAEVCPLPVCEVDAVSKSS